MLVSEFAEVVKRLVQDDTVTDPIILDGILAGISAIATRVPRQVAVDVVADGTTKVFALGNNVIAVETVWNPNDGVFYERFPFGSGAVFSGPQQWFERPAGTINFLSAPKSDLVAYCVADYDRPSAMDDDIPVPDRLIGALGYYVAAYVVSPEASGVSQIRPYGTRIDSGDPEDNPLLNMTLFFMHLFEREMARITPYSIVS